MRRMFTVLAASFAIVAFSSVTFAQAPATTSKTTKSSQTTTKTEKKEATTKATTATGSIEKYDPATKTLTVKTKKKGDENFALNADTKIMAGSKAATDSELVAGKNVKVAYTEAAGQMTATKVTLVAEKSATKTTEPKKEEKK